MSLKGRLALVTGSSSGIGLGIARRLAAAGADLVVHGLGTPADLDLVASRLREDYGVGAVAHGADLSKPADIADLMAEPQRYYGRHVDILVNNAGMQHVAPVQDFPDDKWDQILAVNLSSNFYTIKHALGPMLEVGWGRIVNIASTHGRVASAKKAPYVASKHGVLGLTKAVALETAGTQVTCNAICPGWVLTPLVEQQIDARVQTNGTTWEEESRNLVLEKQPSGDFVLPEHVGGLVTFLCSEDAAEVRGAAIGMD
eukprot:CAMPEP_0118966470 /NCGR_PEP_ID=MMETSP1173-20130426/3940_1 /TAXON_ID=1034831 /ORGANISM="Rhizochromulina marina cf, Strain CCMP1243" /LENGTH=256 /DNA_ID=CAMNT_0006915261 /DNA_START=63 /DNA_END=830 /DNA_ORIENTATION=+